MERGPEVRAATGAGAEFLAGDSLRALAALAVMCFHSAVAAGLGFGFLAFGTLAVFSNLPMRIVAAGIVGPFLFFALSGYLLGRPFAQPLGHALDPAAAPGAAARRGGRDRAHQPRALGHAEAARRRCPAPVRTGGVRVRARARAGRGRGRRPAVGAPPA